MNTASPTALALKLSDFPDFKVSDNADNYVQTWITVHARVATGGGDPPLPVVYFPTTEKPLPIKPGDETEVLFQNVVGPLQIRGTLRGSQLKAEVGFSPNPAIFWKLDDLEGDLSKGPVDTKDLSAPFYKGKVTVTQRKSLSANGNFDVIAMIDWIGLGAKIVKTEILLIL